MTPDDLAAIEARAAAASPRAVAYSYEGTTRGGPPRHQYSICNGTWQDEDTRPHKCIAMVYSDTEEDTADVVFFVNARHDVTTLLAHVTTLTAERDAALSRATAAEARGDVVRAAMERIRDRELCEADRDVQLGTHAVPSGSHHYAAACAAIECIDALAAKGGAR